MKSIYKKLGPYIQPVDIRNIEDKKDNLLGVSTNKVFIPSVANTVGTDFTKYKKVKKGQFTYVPDTSRRGDRIGIAMLENEDEAIVSQAYTVFEVKDHEELLPEYLMMWFRRPEFDRYARFKSHGSVREIFDWEEMCDVELPVPHIDKQREIVKEYHTIVDRIALNEELNRKLEETAQAIYKQWFVDFEFPVSKGYAAEIGKPELEGKPYKSSGGEMVWNEELEKEIPVGWEDTNLGRILCNKGYIRGPFGSALKKEDMVISGIPVYEQQHAIYDHRKFRYYISEEKFLKLKRFSVNPGDLIISCSGTMGKISIIKSDDKRGVINQALLILRVDDNIFNNSICKYFLSSPEGQNQIMQNASGSAQVNMAKREIIELIPLCKPENVILQTLGSILKKMDSRIEKNRREIEMLRDFQELLLSKMTKAETTT